MFLTWSSVRKSWKSRVIGQNIKTIHSGWPFTPLSVQILTIRATWKEEREEKRWKQFFCYMSTYHEHNISRVKKVYKITVFQLFNQYKNILFRIRKIKPIINPFDHLHIILDFPLERLEMKRINVSFEAFLAGNQGKCISKR